MREVHWTAFSRRKCCAKKLFPREGVCTLLSKSVYSYSMNMAFVKRWMLYAALAVQVVLFFSCAKAQKEIPVLIPSQKNHVWYYFTPYTIERVDLPQHAPAVLEKPWTEAIRISSAGSVPGGQNAYAVVNHAGVLECTQTGATLYPDVSIFSDNSAEGLVFSDDVPVFYLYRSTFFYKDVLAPASNARPFLMEFNPRSKISFPLVSYANLQLGSEEQVTGFVWNGKTWACSTKRILPDEVIFSYFLWEPIVALTELSPALSADVFTFTPSTERDWLNLNMPHLFYEAPKTLKKLLKSIPASFPFYIQWRDTSGTSPVYYYQEGNGDVPVNAFACQTQYAGYTLAVFADGTTYVQRRTDTTEKLVAFRLPLLPAGYCYGECAVAGNTLYVAWEQRTFYKTGRAGCIAVNLASVLSQVN